MKKLPIGIQSFGKLIMEGHYYVDKTPFVKKLEDGGYYFLSRPRRFGKSLFLDTLKVPALNQSYHSELFNLAGQYCQTRPLILTKQGQAFL